MSGLPKPRSITSAPSRRSLSLSASISANAYGGSSGIRRSSITARHCASLYRIQWLGMGKTLFEKIWERHVVAEPPGEPALLYVDLHLIHEVTSPQAFEGLRLAGRPVRRPDR